LKVDPNQGKYSKAMAKSIQEHPIGSSHQDQNYQFDSDETGDPARIGLTEDIPDTTKFSLLSKPEVHGEPKYRDEPEIRTVVFERC